MALACEEGCPCDIYAALMLAFKHFTYYSLSNHSTGHNVMGPAWKQADLPSVTITFAVMITAMLSAPNWLPL